MNPEAIAIEKLKTLSLSEQQEYQYDDPFESATANTDGKVIK